MPDAIEAPAAPLFVACLCAAWCRTCDDYRPLFERLAPDIGADVRFAWIDIEDHDDALGDIDVVDFPTLLIARGEQVHFFGPVTPFAATARQLIERALRGELAQGHDAALAGLPGRLGR